MFVLKEKTSGLPGPDRQEALMTEQMKAQRTMDGFSS